MFSLNMYFINLWILVAILHLENTKHFTKDHKDISGVF